MRIGSQNTETGFQSSVVKAVANTSNVTSAKTTAASGEETAIQTKQLESSAKGENDQKNTVSKEKLEEAVSSINEFLNQQQKASKFVFHEGLDKYYVKLIDAETEEVIKEIPPEKLLNAFYEMQKLAGMIVDEKI